MARDDLVVDRALDLVPFTEGGVIKTGTSPTPASATVHLGWGGAVREGSNSLS